MSSEILKLVRKQIESHLWSLEKLSGIMETEYNRGNMAGIRFVMELLDIHIKGETEIEQRERNIKAYREEIEKLKAGQGE